MKNSIKTKKVMLGMSGGVDSSVAAALLLKQGYDVTGITMQIWPEARAESAVETGCCSLSAVDDARRVANVLGIPYYVLNFKDLFKEKVIDNFIDEYIKGRTPNPCIMCNRFLKFEALLDKAMAMGFDFIATGHYASVAQNEADGRFRLIRSKTEAKDQTYALYSITQEQLAHTLFPVGNFGKDEIRAMAKDFGLPVYSKPDSQEICFIEDDDYARFIRENKPEGIIRGNFVDVDGNVLGRHDGIHLFTIGQRKGFGISFGRPMYVIDIDASTGAVTLGEKQQGTSGSLRVDGLNFIHLRPEEIPDEMRAEVKIRYSAKPAAATIRFSADRNSAEAVFDSPQWAVTPGQSAVFYSGETVLGGGIIQERGKQ